MRKIIMALIALLAASAFAPGASAMALFARQTGMACNACHFQHYPALNAFGRSFKASGFTMVGSQPAIEGENLSFPGTINASFLTSLGYESTNAVQTNTPLRVNGAAHPTGAAFVGATGGEASLFVGGRGNEYVGYLGEVTLGGGAAAMDSFKTPILYDVSGTRVGVVPFSTNGQGVSYSFETLNTGANAVHSISNTVGFDRQYINAISAQQWLGTGAAATGAAFVAENEYGFINITKFDQVGPSTANYGSLTSTYARIAATFDFGGWDTAIGMQNWSGSSVYQSAAASQTAPAGGGTLTAVAAVYTPQDTNASAIDAQMQGSVGGMPLGLYITHASAPIANTGTSTASDGSNPAITNAFNGGTFTKSSNNIAVELGVIPEKMTIGIAARNGNSGVADAAGDNATDNATYLTATYKLAQNLLARLSYVNQTGTYWDVTNTTDTTKSNGKYFGTTSTTINLYALF